AFITNWLVCGPFPNNGGQNINTDFLVEHGGETGIHPSPSLRHASSSVPEGSVSWQNMRADGSGKLDFRALLFPNEKNIAYAAAVIECDEKVPALLKTGSNDRLKVWLNGKLVFFYPDPRGSGPDADQTPVILKKGRNLLLAKVDQVGGNWWLYARFEKLISIDNRIFVRRPVASRLSRKISDSTIADLFSVQVFNATDEPVGPVFFDVLSGGERKGNRATFAQIKPGQAIQLPVDSEIALANATETITADLRVASGNGQKTFHIEAERLALPNHENLQVYIVPHSHADLSWPHTPEVSTNLNVEAIHESINILKDLPNFRFSEEDVFVFREFLRRYPERMEEVKNLLHKNILECGGFYFGPSEALLGGEGLIRNLYFGKLWLKNTFGVNTEMAWNVDEPGHTLQMPQILAKAGIKNFIIWKVLMRHENNLNVTGYVGPAIFRWQAPDGSKILVTHCPEGYGAGTILRTDFPRAEASAQKFIEAEAGEIQKWHLPPVVLMADGSDCSIPDPRVAVNAKRWNEKYGSPRLKVASTVEYFQAVEDALEKNQGKVQTIAGELPCWWDGTQSVENDAFMLTRHAEPLITAAEKFSAMNDVLFANYEYPRIAVNAAWKGKLWVHEHNWGGTDGDISDAIKLATARQTFRLADDLVTTTLDSLVSNIRCRDTGIPLVVFNSLAWPRTDIIDHIITLDEPGVRNLHLLDADGKNIPLQIQVQATHADGSIARAQVIFMAQVPALGYTACYLVPGKGKTSTTLVASKQRLENQFFSVQIDTSTGGIISIFDKTNKREILNSSTYQGNELIAMENLGVDEAEEFTDKNWRMAEKPASVTLVESGQVRATIRVKGSIINSGRTQEISLYASVPRIDLKTILNWDGYKAVQVNAVFPFKIEQPRLTYEVPFGMVEYGKENSYAMAAHPTVRGTNNWIDLSNAHMGITLATEVTPFDTKDRLDPRFHDARSIKGTMPETEFSMFDDATRTYRTYHRIAMQDPLLLKSDFVIQPILLRSVFSCGDQNLYFTQEGVHPYRFSIRTHRNTLVPHDAAKFGWEHNTPLLVRQGQSNRGNLPDSQSFIEVSAPNILVTVVKKAEDGKGIILRCYETDGRDTNVSIKCPAGTRRATLTNIIEEDQAPIAVEKGGVINMHVGKYAIETVRLEFE
ncbi:MAG: hypothetical protein GWP06_16360, partial [Actinobacteria bacterium]|nr:hypothetical protein [Actinomycetota bacterium]